MKAIVLEKFLQNYRLERRLLDTGDAILIEGNWWNDKFWGVCKGEGCNMLGQILMEVRDYINNLAERGVISHEAAANRILLIEVMHEAGLYPYRREWWHFEEIISISTTRSKYELLDF